MQTSQTGHSPSPTAEYLQRGSQVHFVGIGGCGMSGLARLLLHLDVRCTGSDQTPSAVTQSLGEAGIRISHDHGTSGLPENCDLVVASAAINASHPDLVDAAARGIEIITYAEALGMIQMRRTGISIAGTHGKSTTAAMLCHCLVHCGLDPSFIVGAQCRQLGGGSRTGGTTVPGNRVLGGKPGLLVAEACEFNRSFHHHRPQIALINNVEEDHLDIYGSLEHVVEAFGAFAALLPDASDGGKLLIAHEGAHRRQITAGLRCDIATFGFSPAAGYQVITDPGVRRVGVLQDGVWLSQWTNTMPGEHNAMNSAAAAILAHWAGGDWEQIAEALSGFEGVDRRMQRTGSCQVRDGTVVVYDDYGHHPTEIEMTLQALRAAEKPQRLVCVFQPHQHSRTRFLLDEFAQSFAEADVVIVPHIYFVRDSEIEKHKVSARDLVDRLRGRGVTAMHLYPFDAIVEQLQVLCAPGDLLVIMGAGPVGEIAGQFLEAMKRS